MGSRYAWLITLATAIGTVLSAIALHGKAALNALASVPAVLQAWASGLPLGIWSFLLSLVLGTLVWLTAIVKLPRALDGGRRHFGADTICLCACLLVTMTQQEVDGGPGRLLSAVWIGLIAGLLAPYIGSGLRALVSQRADRPLPAPQKETKR